MTKLKAQNINHYILSAQHQYLLNKQIHFFNIRKYFNQIIGQDNYYAHSKEKNGLSLIKKLHLNRQTVIMIGDTKHDYEVAQTLGIDCLLLSHGHNSQSKLLETGSIVLQNLDDINKFFDTTN